MIKITEKTQQVIMDNDERFVLRKEIEDAFIAMDCKVDKFSSRVCERGTKSCIVHHLSNSAEADCSDAKLTDEHGHITRFSDSSLYDEICIKCGATDMDNSLDNFNTWFEHNEMDFRCGKISLIDITKAAYKAGIEYANSLHNGDIT